MKWMSVPGVALVSIGLLAGCSGEEKVVYENCTVERSDDKVVVLCPDGTEEIVEPPASTGGCELTDNQNGTYTVACEGSEPITLHGDAPDGGCQVERSPGEITIICGDETTNFKIPHCGNGLIEAGEVCDDGAANGSCELGESDLSCTYCLTTCDGFGQNGRTRIDGAVVAITQGELGVVEGVTVTIGGQEVVSDAFGKFTVPDLAPGTYVVRADGGSILPWWYYEAPKRLAPQFTRVTVREGGQVSPVILRKLVGFSKTFTYDGTPTLVDQSVDEHGYDDEYSAWKRLDFELGPDSLVDSNGQPFTGEVELTIYPVFMPTDSTEKWLHYMQGIPNPFNADGEQLRMWAASAIELRAAGTDDKLALAPGGNAAALISADQTIEFPMHLWHFDEDEMVWVQSSSAVSEIADIFEVEEYDQADEHSKVGMAAVRVDLESFGWVAAAEVDDRAWTCIRGQTTPGAANIGVQFEGGNTQTGTAPDGTFCVDVPVTDKIILHGQAYRSAHERFSGQRTEDLSSASPASCATAPTECLDLGAWALDDVNGYCINAAGAQIKPLYNSDDVETIQGTFTSYRELDLLDLDSRPYVRGAMQMDHQYRWGPVSFPQDASCLPANWRHPRFYLRDEEKYHCKQNHFVHIHFPYGTFANSPTGPMTPICTDDGTGCLSLDFEDEFFYCGS